MSAFAFKGTSVDQDPRFQKALAARKKATKFPPIFSVKVDLNKVNRDQMKNWVSKRLVELFEGLEDEVLINLICAYLDQPEINPEDMQLMISDMLENDTFQFMEELWTLLVDAQSQATGIPATLLAAARADLESRKRDNERIVQGMRVHAYNLEDLKKPLNAENQEKSFQLQHTSKQDEQQIYDKSKSKPFREKDYLVNGDDKNPKSHRQRDGKSDRRGEEIGKRESRHGSRDDSKYRHHDDNGGDYYRDRRRFDDTGRRARGSKSRRYEEDYSDEDQRSGDRRRREPTPQSHSRRSNSNREPSPDPFGRDVRPSSSHPKSPSQNNSDDDKTKISHGKKRERDWERLSDHDDYDDEKPTKRHKSQLQEAEH